MSTFDITAFFDRLQEAEESLDLNLVEDDEGTEFWQCVVGNRSFSGVDPQQAFEAAVANWRDS